jgi:DNA-binding transcriptional ArsR family regulator
MVVVMEKFCNEAFYKVFSTLANRTRLAIIDVLMEAPKTVSEVSIALNLDPEFVSENLNQLEGCALLRSEHVSQQKRYSVNLEIVEPLRHVLARHTAKYCPNLEKCIPQEKLKDYLKKEASKETYIEHE